MVRFRVVAVLSFAVFAEPLLAQEPELAGLRVRVLSAADGMPLVGARVGLRDVGMFTLSDTAGVASLTGIPPGVHAFEVVMFGYSRDDATLELGPGAFASGDVRLAYEPIALEEIMVEGRSRWSAQLQRSGFYERAENTVGLQLDRTAIREFDVVRLSQVLDRIPQRPGWAGFIDPGPTIADVDFTRELPPECAPSIYVDGTPWGGGIDDVPLLWIEGLEFFTSPVKVPSQYLGGGAFCGLLLIWTS